MVAEAGTVSMPAKLKDLGHSENLIVVSDVHMRTPDDERTKAFLDFLGRIETQFKCDTLVLLGDIFDFFNARQLFYFQLWKPVFDRLRTLKEAGVRVVFVEGNHDYGFEHSPRPEIRDCFFDCGDVVLKLKHKRLGDIVLLHSDDVVCPPSYRIFRSLVKSETFQTLLAPVPGRLTSAIFSRYAGLSRARDDYRVLEQQFLTDCALRFKGLLSADFGLNPRICVFGHIHVNLDDELDDVRFLSGPAWFSSPNLLWLSEDGRVERCWLAESGAPVETFRFSTHASKPDSKSV